MKNHEHRLEETPYWHPLNYSKNPPTILAADKETTLYRFDVSAVVYARDLKTALQTLEQANIYLDAACIVGEYTDSE